MAIIWADSFDHYGTTPNGGRDAMLAGAWAAFSWANGNPPIISPDQSRTGDNALKINYNSLATAGVQCRRVFGSAKLVIGLAFGVYFDNLPDTNNNHGWEIRNGSNAAIIRCTVESDGSIAVRKGADAGTNIGTSDPIIQSDSWQHIEMRVTIDDLVGSVEIRVNGITVFSMTNQDFGTVGTTQCVFGMPYLDTGGSLIYYFDDIVAWDDSGSYNNTFLGQQRVTTIFPVADTAAADWVPTGDVDGFDCIDNVPPDGDTTYIVAADVADISEFELGTLPPETALIAGVYIPVMARLSDAGMGNVQTSLVSGVDVSLGPDQTLTTAFTYWGGSHPVDPATSLPWTKVALEAALLRVEKTV